VRRGTIAMLGLVILAMAPAAPAQVPDRPEERGESRRCNAIEVERRSGGVLVRTYEQLGAITHPRRFGTNAVLWTSVSNIGCGPFRELIVEVLVAPDELLALRDAGWQVASVERLRIDGVALHQVRAVKGKRRIVYVRRGGDPHLSSSLYMAGQTLAFPRTKSGCTAGFVLRLGVTGTPVGTTAGHCSDYAFFDASGTWQTEAVTRVQGSGKKRRRTALGSVALNTAPREAGPDALSFALDGVRNAAQEIDRGGGRPRLRVTGWVPTSEQRKGRVVCSYGRRTGEQCGRIDFTVPLIAEQLVCAQLKRTVIPGDSGGPVYTRPRGRSVRAVGVVKGSIDLPGPLYTAELCYTPIQKVLETFGAELPTGSFAVPRPPPPPPG
jgi:hypothetical protein